MCVVLFERVRGVFYVVLITGFARGAKTVDSGNWCLNMPVLFGLL